MKHKCLLSIFLISALLSGCAISVDLYELNNKPGQSQEGGDTPGGGDDDSGTDSHTVNESVWNAYFMNLPNSVLQSNVTVETYENNVNISNKIASLYDDNGSVLAHYIAQDQKGFIKRYNDNYYEIYMKESGQDWTLYESRTSFDYVNFLDSFLLYFPISFNSLTYNSSNHSYEATDITVIYPNSTSKKITNVKAEFLEEKLQKFTFTYNSKTQINVYKDYGTTLIDFDYDPDEEFIEQIVLDSSVANNEVGSFDDQYGKYMFHFENFEGGYEQPYFGKIRQGGYITNLTPMPYLTSITVECDDEPGVSPILFTQHYYPIKSPHQGSSKLYDDESHTLTIRNDYFSLYVPNEEARVYSITLNFDKNAQHDEIEEGYGDVITLMYFNDLHGHLTYANKNQPGYLSMMVDIEQMKSMIPECSLILSGGDQYQGSAYSNMSGGDAVSYLFNATGLDAQVMGNHEFDWGLETIENTINKCNFPTLGSNIVDPSTGEVLDFLQPTTIVEKGNHKIGIIGSAGNTYDSIAEYRRNGFEFITGDAHTELIKQYSDSLRAQGAECIILIIHDESYVEDTHFYPYDESLSSQGYVDIVLDAHTHETYYRVDDYGVPHIQSGQYAEGFTTININFEEGNKIEFDNYCYHSMADKHYEYFTAQQIFNAFNQPGVGPNENLSYNSRYLSKQEISQELSSLYLEYMSNAGSAILLDHGIESSITCAFNYPLPRAYIQQGTVTFNDIYTALPFDNPIGVASVKGSDLKKLLFHKESTTYAPTYLEESSLEDNQIYYVICDAYNYAYTPNKMTLIDTFDADMLRNEYGVYFNDLISYDSTGNVYARDILRIGYRMGRYNNA